MKKRKISTSVSALTVAIAAGCLVQDVHAASALEEVVVTARKTEENVQAVPIAITAFSGEDLTKQNAVRVQDIAMLTPNMQMAQGSGAGTSVTIQIRGQFQNDVIATLDQAVGFYQDGLYLARPVGMNSDLLDISGVEVLKGPQGTLFGRNTTGGAVVMTTHDPEQNLSGLINVAVGSRNLQKATGIINFPIVENLLAARIAVQSKRQDGYVHDMTNDRYLGDQDVQTARGKVLFTPTDEFSLLTSYEITEINQENVTFALRNAAPTGLGSVMVGIFPPAGDTAAQYVVNNKLKAWLNPGEKPINFARVKTSGTTATLDKDWATIKYTFGYRSVDSYVENSLDGLPLEVLSSDAPNSQRQWSHELQATGDLLDDRLQWTGGFYYFQERGQENSNATALGALNPNNPSRTRGVFENTGRAIYAQGTYALTEAWKVTAGVRYSQDNKNLTSHNNQGPAFTCTVPVAYQIPGEPCTGIFKRTDYAPSYTVSTDYQLNDDLMVYFRTGSGYRSGGQNLRGSQSVESFRSFNPEYVTDYELGIKSQFFDNTLRVNAAIYHEDYEDIQRSVIIPTPSGGTATLVQNAAKAKIEGGELEVTAVPLDGLTFGLTLGYTKPEYLSYKDPSTGADLTSQKFDQVPEWNYSLSAQYEFSVGFGTLTSRLDWSWRDDLPQQSAYPQVKQYTTIDAYGVLNGRIGLDLNNGVTVALYGRNLLDEVYGNQSLYFAPPIDVATMNYASPPREIGLEVQYKYD